MANYYQKAINAVFYANPVKLQQLIDEGHFYNRLLEDTGLLSKPFPIWRITQCWLEAIGDNVENYIEETREELADFIERNKQIQEIFRTQFNVEFTPINYQDYWQDFYCEDPSSSEEDCLDYESPEVLAKLGTTQLDIDLYCAVVKFDFPQVIDLLKKGANPGAPTSDDKYDGGAFERIGTECSYLCTCQLSYAWKKDYEHNSVEDEVGDLVGWAAHEAMDRVLNEYNTIPPEPAPVIIYPEGVHEGSAAIWALHDAGEDSTVVIVDGTRAWFMAKADGDADYRNYSICITGYEKDFMPLFNAKNHDALVDRMIFELDCPESIEKMLALVEGKKEFTIWDFRVSEKATPLEKKLAEISWTDFGTSREYAMNWYYEVARLLKKAGLSDEAIIAKFEAKPIPVLWFRNHGGGVTPESMAQKYLVSEE